MSDPPEAPARPRLPDVALPPAGGGEPVPIRERRQSAVLVLLPAARAGGPPDPDAAAHLFELGAARGDIAGWDGRVLVLGPDARALGAATAASLPALVDADGVVARAAGVTAPAVVIADQFGEVYWASPPAPARPWPPAREVEQWVRYLAIRCAG